MLSSRNLDAIVFLRYLRVGRRNNVSFFDAGWVGVKGCGVRNGLRSFYATGFDQPSLATIPLPSFTTIN
jgi:hypothetical protein